MTLATMTLERHDNVTRRSLKGHAKDATMTLEGHDHDTTMTLLTSRTRQGYGNVKVTFPR